MWAVNSNAANKKILTTLTTMRIEGADKDKLQQVYDTVAMTRIEMFKRWEQEDSDEG